MSGAANPIPGKVAQQREAVRRLGPQLRNRFARVELLVFDCDGVLTDGLLYYDADGERLKAFSARDGLGLALLRAAGLKLALLTGRDSAVASRRAADLRFDAVLLGRFDKADGLREITATLGCDAAATLYMGDDLIDIPALAACGVPVTVGEAPDAVRERACWITTAPAGHGAVREVAELVLLAQGKLDEAFARLTAPRQSPVDREPER